MRLRIVDSKLVLAGRIFFSGVALAQTVPEQFVVSGKAAEKIQELLTELQNQKIEQQITHTRGEIYGSIIHDMNGPLTVISGFAQLMDQRRLFIPKSDPLQEHVAANNDARPRQLR